MKQPSLIAAHAAIVQFKIDVAKKWPGMTDISAEINYDGDFRGWESDVIESKWTLVAIATVGNDTIMHRHANEDFYAALNELRAALELDPMEPTA